MGGDWNHIIDSYKDMIGIFDMNSGLLIRARRLILLPTRRLSAGFDCVSDFCTRPNCSLCFGGSVYLLCLWIFNDHETEHVAPSNYILYTLHVPLVDFRMRNFNANLGSWYPVYCFLCEFILFFAHFNWKLWWQTFSVPNSGIEFLFFFRSLLTLADGCRTLDLYFRI